jgi:hypothetical protein
MEREVKQSEDEKTAEALLSKKTDTAQPSTSDYFSDEKKGKVKGVRECWECGKTSHIRSNCRDYKRKLKREEEDDRDKKRRRRDRDNDNKSRRDQGRKGYDQDNRGGRDYGNSDSDRGRRDQKNRRRYDNGGRRGYSYSAATSDSRETKPTEWFADSGATQHMTGNRDLLVNFAPAGPKCWMVSGVGESKLAVAGQGDVKVVALPMGRRLREQ